MKKLFEIIKKIFSAAAKVTKGPLIEKGGDFLEEALENYAAKKPEQAAALVQSLHAWAPELLILAQKTKSDVDDLAVAEIQAELVEFAVRHNLPLPATEQPPTDSL